MMRIIRVGKVWTAYIQDGELVGGQCDLCPEHGPESMHDLAGALRCGILRDVRITHQIPQDEAAERVGCSQQAWSTWERGTRIPMVRLYRRGLGQLLLDVGSDAGEDAG